MRVLRVLKVLLDFKEMMRIVDVWRSAMMTGGVQCVGRIGTMMTPGWFAGSWDYLAEVAIMLNTIISFSFLHQWVSHFSSRIHLHNITLFR